MKYAPLGRTGIQVSCIGLGTATFGVAPLAENADQLVGCALDLGINLFDTANSYGNQPRFDRPNAPLANARQSAEEILGRVLGARRREVVLCSKVMEPIGPGPNDRGLSRRHIFEQIEISLGRLRTDYLDVYYAHHPDPSAPIEETVRAFNDLVRQGKIRHFALSTFGAWQLADAVGTSERLLLDRPVCNQITYNLANRVVEDDIVPACQRFGLSLTVFSPLGGGLLAGEEAINRPIVGSKRWGFPGFSESQLDIARRFGAIAKQTGHAPAPLALAWLISRPTVASAIIGPETARELEANAAAVDIILTPDLLEQLDALAPPAPRAWF